MKAYYYCKNFTLKEMNNLFAYNCKETQFLSREQKMTRLYKGVLRKLQSIHYWTCGHNCYETYMAESWKARQDFDKIWNSTDPVEIDAMLQKYETFIEDHFEPDFAQHKSRPHGDQHGKLLSYSDHQFEADPIGYYSKKMLVSGEPSQAGFYEEYPNMTGSWMYTTSFTNDNFDYSDDTKAYDTSLGPEEMKQKLDDAHK